MDLTVVLLDILLVLGCLVFAFLLYGVWNYDKKRDKQVARLRGRTLFVDFVKLLLGQQNVVDNIGHSYTSFPKNRFVGLPRQSSMDFLIRDPELIRQTAVKDFDNFLNHRPFTDERMDPILGTNLFSLQDQKWRDMRATLSPAFTGSKMRNMYSLVSECAQQMADYLKKEIEKGPKSFEMKDLFTRYGNDVIATAAFGVKVDSLQHQDNQFYVMGKRVGDFGSFKTLLKFLGFQLMPAVMRFFGVRIIDNECSEFFRELVHGTMSVREREGIVRPDMIHLLMQARQGTLQHDNANTTLAQQQDAGFATVTESDVGKAKTKKRAWTDDELTGQALIFFLAGFQTTSYALCFTCHELAVNPDVQKKLQQEIDQVCDELGENRTPDYEGITRMKYLDMVISEGLRLWPPAPMTDRVCQKTYILEDYDGTKVEIRKGEALLIPSYHLHRDERFHSNPDKFDPERFSDENKKDIKPFTYLPFGVGPRSCIGSRFALMEAKAIMFSILRHFDIIPCEKTQIPLKLRKSSAQLEPEKGFWVAFKPRTDNL